MALTTEEKKYLFMDFPAFAEIDEQVRKENRKRLFVGSIRINRGMYRTAVEDKKYREESLKRQLP